MKAMKQWLAMGLVCAMTAGAAWGYSASSEAVTVQSPGSFNVEEHVVVGIAPFTLGTSSEAGVWLDGEVLFSGTGDAYFDWQPQTLGKHDLEFRLNGVPVTSKTVNVTSLAFAEEKGPNPPTEADPGISITPAKRNLGAGGGVQAIVTSGSGTWEASASESWITLNATNGEAGYPVVYAVGATAQVESRTGYVFVNGHIHTVIQDGLGGSIAPENATFEGTGGAGTIKVAAADGVPWQARANCTWVSLGKTSGTGPGEVSFTVAPLNEILTRQGRLTVAGKTFTVFQYGRRTNKISPTQAECDYLAHALAVTVEALDSTTWRVAPQADWITVEDAGSGKGSGTATLAVAENPSWKARTGTVEIGTETFTVTQEGRTALEFGISPAKTKAGGEGTNVVLAVTATPDLPWSAKSNKSWLTLDAGTAGGAGNGTVAYSIAPNPTLANRSGRIVVTPGDPNAGAKTNTVVQSAAAAAISTNGYEFAADGGAFEVEVSLSDIVNWQIQNTNDWLTVVGPTNRTGPGTVTLQAATNETVYPKEGTVTIAKKTFNVSQKAWGVEVGYEAKVFGTDGGSDSLSIRPEGQASWTAVVSDPTWITVWGADSGTGDGKILYIVSPGADDGAVRMGTITVGDKVVYITQRAFDLAISPTGAAVERPGGTGEFEVSAGTGGVWQAVATVPWITLEEGCNEGMGSGTVRFSYTGNDTGETRTGKIIVAGEVFTLEQWAHEFVAITAEAGHGGSVDGRRSVRLGDGGDADRDSGQRLRLLVLDRGGRVDRESAGGAGGRAQDLHGGVRAAADRVHGSGIVHERRCTGVEQPRVGDALPALPRHHERAVVGDGAGGHPQHGRVHLLRRDGGRRCRILVLDRGRRSRRRRDERADDGDEAAADRVLAHHVHGAEGGVEPESGRVPGGDGAGVRGTGRGQGVHVQGLGAVRAGGGRDGGADGQGDVDRQQVLHCLRPERGQRDDGADGLHVRENGDGRKQRVRPGGVPVRRVGYQRDRRCGLCRGAGRQEPRVGQRRGGDVLRRVGSAGWARGALRLRRPAPRRKDHDRRSLRSFPHLAGGEGPRSAGGEGFAARLALLRAGAGDVVGE